MLTSVLLAGAYAYTLDTDMSGSTFFDNFNFETFASPTHGYVKYSPQSSGLATVENGKAMIRVDTTQTVTSGGRKSIRLHSKKTWTSGLFILDANHMPEGCSVWPAWWFDGPNWPNGGEIDVVEYVNTGVHNHATLHTSAGCGQYHPTDYSGSQGQQNCDASLNGNAGCGFTSNDGTTAGSGFNNVGGGVVAMEFVQGSTGWIKVWNFQRSQIPGDITSGNPNPDSWGTPSAHFDIGSSCPSSHFAAQTMIINTELCGDWAGANGVYNNQYSCGSQTGQYNCVDNVKYNGANFKKAYWEINSIKVYTGRSGGNTPSPQPSGSCTAIGQDPYGSGHLVECCSGTKKCLEASANWAYRCKYCSDSCPDDKSWYSRSCQSSLEMPFPAKLFENMAE